VVFNDMTLRLGDESQYKYGPAAQIGYVAG
jgi:hypothetical protein